MRHPARLLADRGGATAVEFALILPALTLLLLGIMECGRLVWAQSTLQMAVEDAARCASVDTTVCGTAGAVQAYAAGRATGINATAGDFALSAQPCGNQVSATYPFTILSAQVFPTAITLTARACFPA
ncbi:MAG TPA: TadE/TadG family type IV pilus assembly protein [Stellaceae bacterium]|nr:TadE/TadG family type IV pilus assembly protein [Stellaceae bacterium]